MFDTDDRVREAERRLAEVGVDRRRIRIGRDDDALTEMRAEMREELTEGWVLPEAGLAVTKEGAKGLVATTVLCAVIGAIVAAPFAFIDFGMTFAGRLLVLVAIGILFGGTVGIIIGPALAARRPGEPDAVERGVVMFVGADTPVVRDTLRSLAPIRMDVVQRHQVPRGTVVTEPDHTAEDLRRGFHGDDQRPGS